MRRGRLEHIKWHLRNFQANSYFTRWLQCSALTAWCTPTEVYSLCTYEPSGSWYKGALGKAGELSSTALTSSSSRLILHQLGAQLEAVPPGAAPSLRPLRFHQHSARRLRLHRHRQAAERDPQPAKGRVRAGDCGASALACQRQHRVPARSPGLVHGQPGCGWHVSGVSTARAEAAKAMKVWRFFVVHYDCIEALGSKQPTMPPRKKRTAAEAELEVAGEESDAPELSEPEPVFPIHPSIVFSTGAPTTPAPYWCVRREVALLGAPAPPPPQPPYAPPGRLCRVERRLQSSRAAWTACAWYVQPLAEGARF